MEIIHSSKPEEYETDQNATVIINSISGIYFSLDNTWNNKLSDTKNELCFAKNFSNWLVLILYWYNIVMVSEHIIFE